MKRLLNAFKWAWSVYKRPTLIEPSMLRILDAQKKFLKEVAETGEPRITHLANIYLDDLSKSHEHPLLTLWCSANDHHIMTRLQKLNQENQILKNIMYGAPRPKSELDYIANSILAEYEHVYESHFKEIDREFIIKAMIEFRAFR
jgi:hypothetical protein